MNKVIYIIVLLISIGFSISMSRASSILGGEITWDCLDSGTYLFHLKIYRDCNDADVEITQTLDVWGHPEVNSISLQLENRKDISPICTGSAGVNPLACGTGSNSGNGVGAIEEIVYQSTPIDLVGIPPSNGWHFTYKTASIGSGITNIQDASDYGMTLTATMYPIPGFSGEGCIDSAPTFLQSPQFISCIGKNYKYNFNAVDRDLDSLHYVWDAPLDNFQSGSYSPPTNPAPLPFVSGYDMQSPTPSALMNPNNEGTVLNAENGEILFKSQLEGTFLSKVRVDAYRKGVRIASVSRQMQFMVVPYDGENSPPAITPPFANETSFDTTIYAGNLVGFQLKASDFGSLQDGSPQSITISTSGLAYGSQFATPNSGCPTTPCAILDYPPSITNVGNAVLGFSWQTSCDHLIGTNGEAQEVVPYVFVFKIQDDYCPIPEMRYATVTIYVKNQPVLPAPEINCITTDEDEELVVKWEPIADPYGTFVGYAIHGLNGGHYQTLNNINQNSFALDGGGVMDGFYVTTLSGCEGNTERHSDTISNVLLELNNPGNGEVLLSWNKPATNWDSTYSPYYYIYKEYPLGTWTLIDSTLYNTTSYRDTIRVCKEFVNYQVILPTTSCEFTSNIEGDEFMDKIVPDIPRIVSVSIDTLSGNTTLIWNENGQSDTYGYVIYQTDLNGNLVEIDTVWGRENTLFSHFQDPESGPYQYSVAAFDSCYTSNIPPTYQTSAKANPHTTNFLESNLHVCDREIQINWTGYIGFDSIAKYNVYSQTNDGNWELVGHTNTQTFNLDITAGSLMKVVVEAVSKKGVSSFSNIISAYFSGTEELSISYLSVATVEGNTVKVKYRVALNEGVGAVVLERYNTRKQRFEEIDEQILAQSNEIVFIDEDVEVSKYAYTYQVRIMDTCNQVLGYSNIGKTIHLNVITDDEAETHTLQWSAYEVFKGKIQRYEVYRTINGVLDVDPIAVLPPEMRSYSDNLSDIFDTSDGKVCYFVLAREGNSQWGWEEQSLSNTACGVFEPIIYIPNAFTVGGVNPVFKPVTRLRQIDNYYLEIVDRFGKTIFFTTNPEEGWDGKIKGRNQVAKEGVYIYRLSLRDGDGIEVVRYGHLTLLTD